MRKLCIVGILIVQYRNGRSGEMVRREREREKMYMIAGAGDTAG